VKEKDPRYPIGLISYPELYTQEINHANFNAICALPSELKSVLSMYSATQANFKYRPGSWNIAQLVHHIFDSHLNAYIRTKLTLTEDVPVIKPYDENKWAVLHDASSPDIHHSLPLIEHLHARWTNCLQNLNMDQWKRKYFHPDMKRHFTLEEMLHLYAWHGQHHVAQIAQAIHLKIVD
jgi:hypothetical protein